MDDLTDVQARLLAEARAVGDANDATIEVEPSGAFTITFTIYGQQVIDFYAPSGTMLAHLRRRPGSTAFLNVAIDAVVQSTAILRESNDSAAARPSGTT